MQAASMYKPSKRVILWGLALGIFGFALGVWVLLHPASVFVQPWRAERAAAAVDGVLFGPYPVEQDFVELKQRGVTTIISLLEPKVPYENALLEKERKLAQRFGMTVKNFPMGSILGQKFGKDYGKNSRAAAEAALRADGVAYIHCYLGLHRAGNVRRYLAEHAKVQSGVYAGVNATSDADLAAERQAKKLFRAQRYDESLAVLATITRKTPRVRRVEGWNLYRLRRIEQARAAFEQALKLAPDDHDSQVGLAYCDLAQGRLAEAESGFARLWKAKPKDDSVLEGLANAYYRQARWQDAEAAFSQLLERHPGNTEAQDMLARVRGFMQPDPSPAATAAEKVGG